jgi:hypothetical protein
LREDNSRELFKKDFDDELYEAFGKTKKKKQQCPKSTASTNEEEKFAVQMGLDEIRILDDAIQEFINKTAGLIMASQILNELTQFEEDLEDIKELLCWEFNPLAVISKEGPHSYHQKLLYRKQLISELLRKYGRGNSTEKNSN